MIKRFNKLMYYFGYAPIKVSHDVKYYIVQREIKYDKLEVTRSIPDIEFINRFHNEISMKNIKQDLVKQLVDKAHIYIHWTFMEDKLMRTSNYKAELIVGTNLSLK